MGARAPVGRREDNIWTCSPQTAVFRVSETCSVVLMKAGTSVPSPKASVGEEFRGHFDICVVVAPDDVLSLVIEM